MSSSGNSFERKVLIILWTAILQGMGNKVGPEVRTVFKQVLDTMEMQGCLEVTASQGLTLWCVTVPGFIEDAKILQVFQK